MREFICLVAALASPLLQKASAEDAQTELKALVGKWKAVAMEAGGQELPKESVPDFTFTVGAGGKSVAKTPQHDDKAVITVDPKKDPKRIDNLHESGASKGKKQYGIYKLEGDKWTVCMTLPGVEASARPKDFSTKGTANVLFIFERVKEEKK